MAEQSLAEVLNSETPQTEESEVETTTEETEVQGEEQEAPPATKEKEEPWSKQAALDERRKRQEAEKAKTDIEEKSNAKIAELEKQLAALTSKEEVKTVKEEAPDMFDDPKGYEAYIRASIKKEILNDKIMASQDAMREKHSDYDEMEKIYLEEVAAKDPTLQDKLIRSNDPADFAYRKAKAYLEEKKEHEEFLEYRKNKKAVVEDDEEDTPPPVKKPIVKVPDLLKATSAKSDKAPSLTDERSVSEILDNKRANRKK